MKNKHDLLSFLGVVALMSTLMLVSMRGRVIDLTTLSQDVLPGETCEFYEIDTANIDKYGLTKYGLHIQIIVTWEKIDSPLFVLELLHDGQATHAQFTASTFAAVRAELPLFGLHTVATPLNPGIYTLILKNYGDAKVHVSEVAVRESMADVGHATGIALLVSTLTVVGCWLFFSPILPRALISCCIKEY